jgi:hypothetical protein
MERQLTVEQALAEGLAEAGSEPPQGQTAGYAQEIRRQHREARSRFAPKTGEFVIRIIPGDSVPIDPDYELPTGEICIQADDKTYSWLDTMMTSAYYECEDPAHTLIKHILDLGLGEVLVRLQRPQDVQEHEREVYRNENEATSSQDPD